VSDRLYVPSRRFNRRIGIHAGKPFDPAGRLLSQEEWDARKHEWLPSPDDKAYLKSIMAKPVYEAGKFANWIAPPQRGINRLPVDFEYVRTEE
jgi:benzoyl-CoA 2,3-dioxygenase component B